jgi:GMP synthase PP-ATPase subunit
LEEVFKKHFHVNLRVAKAEIRFLERLKGVIEAVVAASKK